MKLILDSVRIVLHSVILLWMILGKYRPSWQGTWNMLTFPKNERVVRRLSLVSTARVSVIQSTEPSTTKSITLQTTYDLRLLPDHERCTSEEINTSRRNKLKFVTVKLLQNSYELCDKRGFTICGGKELVNSVSNGANITCTTSLMITSVHTLQHSRHGALEGESASCISNYGTVEHSEELMKNIATRW